MHLAEKMRDSSSTDLRNKRKGPASARAGAGTSGGCSHTARPAGEGRAGLAAGAIPRAGVARAHARALHAPHRRERRGNLLLGRARARPAGPRRGWSRRLSARRRPRRLALRGLEVGQRNAARGVGADVRAPLLLLRDAEGVRTSRGNDRRPPASGFALPQRSLGAGRVLCLLANVAQRQLDRRRALCVLTEHAARTPCRSRAELRLRTLRTNPHRRVRTLPNSRMCQHPTAPLERRGPAACWFGGGATGAGRYRRRRARGGGAEDAARWRQIVGVRHVGFPLQPGGRRPAFVTAGKSRQFGSQTSSRPARNAECPLSCCLLAHQLQLRSNSSSVGRDVA